MIGDIWHTIKTGIRPDFAQLSLSYAWRPPGQLVRVASLLGAFHNFTILVCGCSTGRRRGRHSSRPAIHSSASAVCDLRRRTADGFGWLAEKEISPLVAVLTTNGEICNGGTVQCPMLREQSEW